MNITHIHDLNPLAQRNVAIAVAWESCAPNSDFAPVAVEELEASELAVAAIDGGQLAGYVRAKNEIHATDEGITYRQIGSLFVAEAFRGQNLAYELVDTITTFAVWQGANPFAFVNIRGRRAFEKSGYRPALPDELPFAKSVLGNEAVVYPVHGPA